MSQNETLPAITIGENSKVKTTLRVIYTVIVATALSVLAWAHLTERVSNVEDRTTAVETRVQKQEDAEQDSRERLIRIEDKLNQVLEDRLSGHGKNASNDQNNFSGNHS